MDKPTSRYSARELLAILTMSVAVLAVYWSPKPMGMSLLAADYNILHQFRLRFAQEALFHEHRLPAWYPRELLGTPFWSNIQNFPFIPTRLPLLLLNPQGPYTYTLAINLAAVLTALFTYLFCRRIGLGMIAAATSGWTFACCGYFSSRVGAGHLPLLEAYCALPLLLWLVECFAQSLETGRSSTRWVVGLTLASTCMLLAGHPQLPVYGLTASAVYAFWRGRFRVGWRTLAAMGIGAGIASFSLFPMALLVQRSTRVLPLAIADNSLAMPYARLAGFFFPWRDGVASGMEGAASNRFHGYPSMAYFWDTFVYTGWLPWIAVLVFAQLFLFPTLRPKWNHARLFLLILGLAGLILSLPITQHIMSFMPGTLLRSPARLLYFTEFSLALALGGLVDWLFRGSFKRQARWLVPVLLVLHLLDVRSVDRAFLPHFPVGPESQDQPIRQLIESADDGRVAVDVVMPTDVNRIVDDVGFFDSIMLARPYEWLVDMSGAPADINVQKMDGRDLPRRALEAAGVKLAVTLTERSDLRLFGQLGPIKFYVTEHPENRAGFFPIDRVQFLPVSTIHDQLRNPNFDPSSMLLLPREFQVSLPPATGDSSPAVVEYRRPNSDRIDCTVRTSRPGYLRVIESWDPGWSATIDGAPVSVAPAMDALLSVPLTSGTHEVKFEYHTPGATAGRAISIFSVILLAGWITIQTRRREDGLPAA